MNSIHDNKILVVNDHSMVTSGVQTIFNAAGYHDVEIDDGQNAKKMLMQNHYDLLIQDLDRPEPNGVELYRWMKSDSRAANIPIILVTVAVPLFISDIRFTVIGKRKFELTVEAVFGCFGRLYIEGYSGLGFSINNMPGSEPERVEEQAARIFRFWMNCRDPEREHERRNRYLWPAVMQDW